MRAGRTWTWTWRARGRCKGRRSPSTRSATRSSGISPLLSAETAFRVKGHSTLSLLDSHSPKNDCCSVLDRPPVPETAEERRARHRGRHLCSHGILTHYQLRPARPACFRHRGKRLLVADARVSG